MAMPHAKVYVAQIQTWAVFLASNTNEMKGRPGLFPKLVALQRTVEEAGALGRCPVASLPLPASEVSFSQ
jgi:hypothetical protein